MVRTILLAAGLAALANAASGQSAEAPIGTASHAEEGEYLVAGNGFALYLFKADRQGRAGRPAVSACEDQGCVNTWPPLTTDGAPMGDATVRAELLGTITRADGSRQVTYDGWPLYFYAEDFAAGDINGSDLESFGEDWYLVGPNGNRSDRDDEDEADRGGRDHPEDD